MIQEHCLGYIQDIKEDGTAVINAALPSLVRAFDRKYNEVEIILNDGRRITALQRKKIFALLGEISNFVHGDSYAAEVEQTKEMMKWEFVLSRMEAQERRLFSLSNVDETTAREFITYLIDFIIQYDVPTAVPLIENCEDISRMVYACLMAKKCVCCGKPANLHHVQSVGSQGYRDKIDHRGLDCLPLCPEHHQESHNMGQKDFMAKWHLQPVKIDDKICKLYHLNKKEKSA
jgi:hypothetical protein